MGTVWFGANDAALPQVPGQQGPDQHVSLKDFRANYLHLLTRLPKGLPLLLLTPPPIDSRIPTRILSTTAQYVSAIEIIGREQGIPVVDVWGAVNGRCDELFDGWRDEGGVCGIMVDGIHLGVEGNKIVADLVIDAINHNYPELMPSALPSYFPYWNEFRKSACPCPLSIPPIAAETEMCGTAPDFNTAPIASSSLESISGSAMRLGTMNEWSGAQFTVGLAISCAIGVVAGRGWAKRR